MRVNIETIEVGAWQTEDEFIGERIDDIKRFIMARRLEGKTDEWIREVLEKGIRTSSPEVGERAADNPCLPLESNEDPSCDIEWINKAFMELTDFVPWYIDDIKEFILHRRKLGDKDWEIRALLTGDPEGISHHPCAKIVDGCSIADINRAFEELGSQKPESNWSKWVIGGVAVAGIIGLVWVSRSKRN